MRYVIKSVPMTVGALVLIISLVFVGCDGDAQRIREINEILATPAADRTPLSAEITTEEIQDGDCINSTLPEGISIETVVIVPCAGNWQYRVLSSFAVANADSYPGEDFFEQRAYESCDRRYSYFLFPLAESWSFGDRTVNCLQDSFGLSIIDPGKLDRLVSASSLSPGECYNDAPETDYLLVELVDCHGEWQYRVLGSFDVADIDRYPGEDFFSQRAYESCDRRYSLSTPPSSESWRLGDQTVYCLQDSFGLSAIDPGKLDRLVSANSLRSGECYNDAPETDYLLVELVDCHGEWQYRVLGSFDVADIDRYPGEDFFSQRAYESCDRRYSLSTPPSSESWRLGDQTVYCLQDSFGLSAIDPGKLDRLVSANSLRSGECYNDAPETDYLLVELVDCHGEWQYRLLSSFAVADADQYPGEDLIEQRVYESCDRRYSYFQHPSPESWRFGDRTVNCLQDSFGLSAIDPGKLDRLVSIISLSPGECYNDAPETDGLLVELLDCSGEWQYRVLSSFAVADADHYPREDFFRQQASESCNRPYNYFLFPLAESWRFGDRTVKCVQQNLNL